MIEKHRNSHSVSMRRVLARESAALTGTILNDIFFPSVQTTPYLALTQDLLDNTALLREQMAGAQALAEKEVQEDYLRVKQMEAYERR